MIGSKTNKTQFPVSNGKDNDLIIKLKPKLSI